MNKYRILTAALSSKATVDDFTFCRSSDLLLFTCLPTLIIYTGSGVSGISKPIPYRGRWSSQQRDCSGLAPDSLFIRFLASVGGTRNKTWQR